MIFGAFCNAFLSKALKRLIRQERPLYTTNGGATATAADAAHLVQAAASGVVASAVDAAVFTADELGVSHPSPTPVMQALPVPMTKDLGHGMPSSHAMSLFYFAAYIALACEDIILSTAHYDTRGVSPHPVILVLRRLLPDWMETSWDAGTGRIVFIVILFSLVCVECWTRVRRRLHTWAQIVVGSVLGAVVGSVHYFRVMPMLREASRDIPPLAERSTTFVAMFTIGMTLMAALTLGQRRHAAGCCARLPARAPPLVSSLMLSSMLAIPCVCLQSVARSALRRMYFAE